MGRPLIDLTGRTFGRLTVLRSTGREPGTNNSWWECRCDCGAVIRTRGERLRRGAKQSCGCIRGTDPVTGIKHGMHNASEYNIWVKMKARCYREAERSYVDYGGRGITMCERWRGSFESFYADIGTRPAGTSIDRIDNDGGYWCGRCEECTALGRRPNCRWATDEEQARNKRRSVYISANGITRHVKEWASDIGVTSDAILDRLRRGWSTEDAVLIARRINGASQLTACSRCGGEFDITLKSRGRTIRGCRRCQTAKARRHVQKKRAMRS